MGVVNVETKEVRVETISLRIDKELYKKIKMIAALREKHVYEIFDEALRMYIREVEGEKK